MRLVVWAVVFCVLAVAALVFHEQRERRIARSNSCGITIDC